LALCCLKLVNNSYRFEEKDFLSRKANSIVPWLLLVLFIISFNFDQVILRSAILAARSGYQLYLNFNSLENHVIRKVEFFYPLLTFTCVYLVLL
jgi:hypothetical protein